MGAESRSSVSQPGRQYWKIAVVVLGVTFVVAAGLYNLARLYVLNEAERNIQAVLLTHKGLHRYIQEVMHPVFFSLRAEGMVSEKFYAPDLYRQEPAQGIQ